MGYFVAVDIVERFQDFFDDLRWNVFREAVFIDNFIKKFFSLKVLGNDVPLFFGFEVLEDVEDIGVI